MKVAAIQMVSSPRIGDNLARATMASLQGKPISRIAGAGMLPVVSSLIYSGVCASANIPSLAGEAVFRAMPWYSATSLSRSMWYLAMGKRWPSGNGKTN
jgi:hypothetical protein